jgi:hypothetical protein
MREAAFLHQPHKERARAQATPVRQDLRFSL